MESFNFQKARRQISQRHNAQQLISPFARFTEQQTAGGILLLIFAAVAIACANVPALDFIHQFWTTDLSLSFNYNANFLPLRTVGEWVNSGLMAVFFFAVGLELKREIVVGELSTTRNALLPIFAAIGGIVVPVVIFLFINNNTAGEAGWSIPMATDIALTVTMLSLLGRRVPIALKVFLIALTIVDDLAALVLTAIAYPSDFIHSGFLIAALLILVALVTFRLLRINRTFPYIFLGFLLWFALLRSGIHAAVAGVALALVIPSSIRVNQIRFYVRSKYIIERFKDAYSKAPLLKNQMEQTQLNNLADEIRKATPLLLRLEHSLQPWITYCIIPIFALANMGVVINAESLGLLTNTVSIGIILGLLLGKPIGITLMSWITVKLKLAALPDKTRWSQMIGAGILAGMGFTMSIFIGTIAFREPNEMLIQNASKLAVLITSLCAGVVGLIYMKIVCKKEDSITI